MEQFVFMKGGPQKNATYTLEISVSVSIHSAHQILVEVLHFSIRVDVLMKGRIHAFPYPSLVFGRERAKTYK